MYILAALELYLPYRLFSIVRRAPQAVSQVLKLFLSWLIRIKMLFCFISVSFLLFKLDQGVDLLLEGFTQGVRHSYIVKCFFLNLLCCQRVLMFVLTIYLTSLYGFLLLLVFSFCTLITNDQLFILLLLFVQLS